MTDALTNNYSLTQPLVGGDSGTWGTVLNNATIGPLDSILGVLTSISITSADVNLTTTQFQSLGFVLSGTLTGNHNLTIPLSPNSASVACGGRFIIVNNTTGAFNVTVKTVAAGSTGVTVPQGFAASLYSDGTNVGYASDGLPGYAKAVSGDPNSQLAGTAGSANTNASLAFDYTNGILYICTTTGNSSTAVWAQTNITVPRGFDTAVNLALSVTHTGGNLLNVAVKTVAGTDPSATNPIPVKFQTVSGANTTGVPVSVNITGALSMTSNATGATLGTSNNAPFRFWVALFNNGGTAVLAIRNCSTATNFYPVAEYGVASTTGISGSAASAGVWYTPNGTSLSNCAFRIIGYLEYTSGLATAGTYTSDPSNIVIFGPGVKKPGDVVQAVLNSTTTVGSTSSATFASLASGQSQAITPTSAVNLIRISAQGSIGGVPGGGTTLGLQVQRGSTLIGNPLILVGGGTATQAFPSSILVYDSPGTTSSTTYSFQGKTGSGTLSYPASTGGAVLELQEIMG